MWNFEICVGSNRLYDSGSMLNIQMLQDCLELCFSESVPLEQDQDVDCGFA